MSPAQDELPYAWGGPVGRGVIKDVPEDFVVEEVLGFQPSGAGEHEFLKIEKRGENTEDLAKRIAKLSGLPRAAVGYAGMKDRHGRTIQWFSVQSGKQPVDWTALESPTTRLLEATRNLRKLKTGALQGNRFEITVRDLDADRERLDALLRRIRTEGVPNFFGPQRFGRDGRNLLHAAALFRGESRVRDRQLRGIYLSAARSRVFNAVLARRIGEGHWNRALPGDIFMFSGSHSFFREEHSPDIEARIAALAIHPSGPLWGRGEPGTELAALELEQAVAASETLFCEGLVKAGLEMARRPLRLAVQELGWEWPEAGVLKLFFRLPAGAYATVVLRELLRMDEPAWN